MNRSNAWNFFDRIYCISVDDRHDRRQKARQQFAEVGLLERVEFLIVARHPEDREKGIFQSHMECLRQGLAQRAGNILVFEDDIFFERFDATALVRATESLAAGIPWNGFFLGCITGGSRKTRQRSLVRIRYRCLAHAYALNAPFAGQLVCKPWQGIPFDEVLRRNSVDFYALRPMCAFQGLAGTDNQRIAIHCMRRFFGGLPFIQKANEFYQNNRRLLFSLHLAVFICLGLLLMIWWK